MSSRRKKRRGGLKLLLCVLVPIAGWSFCLGPTNRCSIGLSSSSTGPVRVATNPKSITEIQLEPSAKRKSTRISDVGLLRCTVPSLLLSFPILPAFSLELGSDVSLSLSPPFLLGGADPRFFLAGGICAAFSHGITTPIDVVKTRQQVDPRKYGVGVVEAAQIIVEEEGAGALLKGLGPTIVGYGIEGAAKFGFYESLKPTMSQLLHLDNPAIPYLTASVIAGAAASIILCPLERTRIRLVTDPNFAPNLLTGIPLLVKESGFQSLFSGCPAMLSKQVPYTFGKQVSFDEVAKFLYSVVANPDNPWTKLEVSFVSAFLASIAACLLSQPGDVILTDTYKDRGSKPLRFSNVTAAIYQRQGLKGFYSGLTARLLQVGTIITSQLLLYDYIKQGLGLPATGSS